MTKISRGGGIFEKFSARGGVYQKYPPTPLFPLPARYHMQLNLQKNSIRSISRHGQKTPVIEKIGKPSPWMIYGFQTSCVLAHLKKGKVCFQTKIFSWVILAITRRRKNNIMLCNFSIFPNFSCKFKINIIPVKLSGV